MKSQALTGGYVDPLADLLGQSLYVGCRERDVHGQVDVHGRATEAARPRPDPGHLLGGPAQGTGGHALHDPQVLVRLAQRQRLSGAQFEADHIHHPVDEVRRVDGLLCGVGVQGAHLGLQAFQVGDREPAVGALPGVVVVNALLPVGPDLGEKAAAGKRLVVGVGAGLGWQVVHCQAPRE